jgi:O-antigen/teichoic acid export membrane protein
MRTKSTFYNILIRLSASLIPSFLALILNNIILVKFGSDVNGVISTVGQLINLLMIFEGGFTMATTIALYKPYLLKDYEKINSLLSAIKSVFSRIGLLVTILGLILAIITPYYFKSEVDRNQISILLIIATTHLGIQFFITSSYNILFSVAQIEYKSSALDFVFNISSQVLSIISIINGGSIVFIKIIALVIPTLRIPFLIKMFKNNFPFGDLSKVKKDFSFLTNTKDIFSQKIANLIFGSTDLIIISFMIDTKNASIYAVYNMIFIFIKGIILSIILSPFHSFGQLYAENNNNKLRDIYKIFQFISIIIINIFLSAILIVILPFIDLYTINVVDINYINPLTALLFCFSVFLELLSYILGSFSNSTGHFSSMKRIAFIGAALNIVFSLFFVSSLGINGVLLGTIIAYIFIVLFQVYLVHIKILKSGFFYFAKILFINIVLAITLNLILNGINIYFENYVDFFFTGFILFIFISFIVTIVNVLFNSKTALESYSILKRIGKIL